MTWADVYRNHWAQVVNWCRRVYGPAVDAENIAQAAFAAMWRCDRSAVLGWSRELTTWHLIRHARLYVARRPTMHQSLSPIPGDLFPGKPDAGGVAEYLPDDFPADLRAVVLAACDEGKSLSDIGGSDGKAAAVRAWRNAVNLIKRSERFARDHRYL